MSVSTGCRTRRDRSLELTSARRICAKSGRYFMDLKMIDILGDDMMTLVTVNVG